jgi:hypothetical protein
MLTLKMRPEPLQVASGIGQSFNDMTVKGFRLVYG